MYIIIFLESNFSNNVYYVAIWGKFYKFEKKYFSETMSVRTFHYVQQLMDSYFDGIQTDKKKITLWSRRLHIALLAYRELLLTINAMDKSTDVTVRDSANVIKSNLFYTADYREFIITLLHCYNELIMSDAYLRDLIETQHIFLKMFEKFCGTDSSVIIQKKSKKKRKSRKGKCIFYIMQIGQNMQILANLVNFRLNL